MPNLTKIGINTSNVKNDQNFRRNLRGLLPSGKDYLIFKQVSRVYQINYRDGEKDVFIYEHGVYKGIYTIFQGQLVDCTTISGLYKTYDCYEDNILMVHKEYFNEKRVGKWYGQKMCVFYENLGCVCFYFIDGNNVSETEYKKYLNVIKKDIIFSGICQDLADIIICY